MEELEAGAAVQFGDEVGGEVVDFAGDGVWGFDGDGLLVLRPFPFFGFVAGGEAGWGGVEWRVEDDVGGFAGGAEGLPVHEPGEVMRAGVIA